MSCIRYEDVYHDPIAIRSERHAFSDRIAEGDIVVDVASYIRGQQDIDILPPIGHHVIEGRQHVVFFVRPVIVVVDVGGRTRRAEERGPARRRHRRRRTSLSATDEEWCHNVEQYGDRKHDGE